DGDGDDELGVVGGGKAYLIANLDETTASMVFDVPGNEVVAGDFDGDGIDTLAGFDSSSNTFTILAANEQNAATTKEQLGHAESAHWRWSPLAGRWQQPASPAASQGYAWPVAGPESKGFNALKLGQALDDGASVANVNSVLVVRDGALVAERYYHGYERHIAGNIKSVSKSVLSGLFGIAIDKAVIGSLDDTVSTHLPSYFQNFGAEKKAISIEDIMTMRSGLAWTEGSPHLPNMIGSANYLEYVLSQKLVTAPGSTYRYSTGLTHVGSALLTAASGKSTRAFAREHLFEEIGISTPRWDRGVEGNFVGGAEMWMRPRDLARFGQLFLRDGKLDGKQVISQSWVQASADPWVPEGGNRFYGLWWRERPWSNYEGVDSYFAWGYGGQFLFLFPSQDLIVVVTSKWNVPYSVSGQSAGAIFSFVNNQILTTLGG
ncbi:MAG: serine hydrolase, partial [Polyangiaceae bacterium]